MSVRSTLTRALAAASLVAVGSFAAAPAMAFSFGAEAEAETEVAPTAHDCDEEESRFCRPAEQAPSFRVAPPRHFIPYDDGARPTPTPPPVCDIYGDKYSFVYGERCIMPTEENIDPPPPLLMDARG